ncbi:hypothetical protein FRX31_015912, partial [Thalictrum thalictroides]
YTSPYYTVEKFRATYEGFIYPIANEENWGKLREEDLVLPPSYTAAPGRPKTLRIREEDELEPTSNRRCNICKQPNHNVRTCKARQIQKEKAAAAKQKQQKKTGGKNNSVNTKKPSDYGEITVQHTKKKQRKEISSSSSAPTPTPSTQPTPRAKTIATQAAGTSGSNKGGRVSKKGRGGGNTFGRMPWWLGELGSSMQEE